MCARSLGQPLQIAPVISTANGPKMAYQGFARLHACCAMESRTSLTALCYVNAEYCNVAYVRPQLEVRRFLQLLLDPDTKPDGELHIVSTAYRRC